MASSAFPSWVPTETAATGKTYRVATTGSDTTGDGGSGFGAELAAAVALLPLFLMGG